MRPSGGHSVEFFSILEIRRKQLKTKVTTDGLFIKLIKIFQSTGRVLGNFRSFRSILT
jgi:hypothetical protein